MRLTYHPAAEREIVEAAYFYDGKLPGLGVDFLDEVDRVAKNISESPQQFAAAKHDIRRATLKRFPYGIYFRQGDDAIRILAVRHHSRHPDFGLERK